MQHDFELRPYEVRYVQTLFVGEFAVIYSRKHSIKRSKKSFRPFVPLRAKAFRFQKNVQKFF